MPRMVARVGTWSGSPEELEDWVRGTKDVEERIRESPGLEAAYWLVDREGGKALTITMWTSAEAMAASEATRSRSQNLTGTATGAQVTTARFEIIRSTRI